MRELSVFVDESGDFGKYDYHAPFYIISMVFHDQQKDLSDDLKKLESELSNIGWPNHCVHAGPVIRSEHEYKEYSLEERQRILKRLVVFVRKAEIKTKSIFIEKNEEDPIEDIGRLSKLLSGFIRSNLELFLLYDKVKVYYDNDQVEVTRILSSVFNALLDNVEFKKVIPSEYRLFQVADLICSLRLAELKMNKHVLSKSEKLFFVSERILKKNYLKTIDEKELR